ncbi:MAG TPA: type VI secretion system tube protein Hcp [Gaiellaceae bacterium]
MPVDVFLKLDGIPGESTDSKHKNEIVLQALSWGASNPGMAAAPGGMGAGKVQIRDFSFTHHLDKASPKLFQACCTGQHIKEATVTLRHAGKEAQEFLIYRLKDVLVSSVDIGASEDANQPVESISLQFAEIRMEYRPQKADGTLDAAIAAGFDVRQGKTV